jgi:GDPmannose 4,6-dehydratase
MFANTGEATQDEKTEIRPRTPYGAAKAFGHHVTVSYREGHGIFSCSCICFSHESPRRGPEFVTRKVSQHVARIKLGLANKLSMGNLDIRRDWGNAGDTVRAMWLALQQHKADDYVIATGETHSVRDLLDTAFSRAGLDWHKYVEVDPALLRPIEAENRCGNANKARTVLGWKPEVDFRALIDMMVDFDLAHFSERCKQNAVLQASGA